MAAEKAKPTDAKPAATEAAPAKPMKRWLKIGGIVLAVTAAEIVAAYLYWPRAEAASVSTKVEVPKLPEAEPDVEEQSDQLREVDLGEYRITAYQPLSNTTLRIDFHLYGMVLAGKDELAMGDIYKSRSNRLRDQVYVVVRGCDLNDFTDAGLGLLKRRILETTNKTLGQNLVRSVIFSEFSFIEQ